MIPGESSRVGPLNWMAATLIAPVIGIDSQPVDRRSYLTASNSWPSVKLMPLTFTFAVSVPSGSIGRGVQVAGEPAADQLGFQAEHRQIRRERIGFDSVWRPVSSPDVSSPQKASPSR